MGGKWLLLPSLHPTSFWKKCLFFSGGRTADNGGSVTVNPAPTGFRQIQWQPLSFKAVCSGMATICWVFPCYTESGPKSLSQLPALGKQASKSLSPNSFMEGEGCSLGGFPPCCTFSELEGKTMPYFDSSVQVCSLGL